MKQEAIQFARKFGFKQTKQTNKRNKPLQQFLTQSLQHAALIHPAAMVAAASDE
jgi:hypothetical protein